MRIKVIDGFRTIAVLGVLWAHIWMFSGTPALTVFHINISQLISFFGTGVDLFFVISGFCMYLMYSKNKDKFSFQQYAFYLKKRWLRIAPAFYVAIIVYGLVAVNFNLLLFDWSYAGKHAFFIKNFFKDATQYAPHFWSLCTEWHFYMVLPFLILAIEKFSFYKTMIMIIIVCVVFRGIVWIHNDDMYNFINYSIPNRLIEFIMGILAAKVFIDNRTERIFNSIPGLFFGVFIAFAGRMMMTAGLENRTDIIGIASRTLNLPFLTLGYAIVIINTLKMRSMFTLFLETRIMTSIGKYSYSMYLWHWIIAENISTYANLHWNFDSFLKVNIVFILSVLILYPLSMLSYAMFESLYFKKRKSSPPVLINA